MNRVLRGAAVAASVSLALLIGGCAQTPFSDDSFMQAIPAAVEDAGLGISEVYADKGLDGFTTILAVGGVLDATEISDADLQRLVQIIVTENTLAAGSLDLSLKGADDEFVDLKSGLQRLGARTSEYSDRIDFADATAIAEGAAE